MPSSNDQTRRRASYDIRVHVGRWARVHTCFGGYELPAGLPENAEVRLEAFDRGYWTVRFEGEVFEVAMACVGRAGILWVEPRTLERALTNGTRGQTNFFLRALSVEGC